MWNASNVASQFCHDRQVFALQGKIPSASISRAIPGAGDCHAARESL
jgi:hypothetical protein